MIRHTSEKLPPDPPTKPEEETLLLVGKLVLVSNGRMLFIASHAPMDSSMSDCVIFVCTRFTDVDVSAISQAMMEASARSVCFHCEAVVIYNATVRVLALQWSGKLGHTLKDMCQQCAIVYEQKLLAEEKADGSIS